MRRLFGIGGLACAGCAHGLERRLRTLPGVRSVGVHHLTASALIDWDESRLSPDDLRAATRSAGYDMIARHRPEEMSAALGAEIRRLGIRLAVAVVAGMWSMAPAVAIYAADLPASVAWWLALASGLFALPVVFWAGAGFLWMAWRSVRLRAPGMDLLVAVGAVAAMAVSAGALVQGSSRVWFDTATMLVTLLLLGRLIDAVTRRGALDALTAMEAAAPETALVPAPTSMPMPENGGWVRVPCSMVEPGDIVAVDAGDAVSMDGVVTSGCSLVSRAVLTGESAPVAVGPGARVEAGTLNLGQRLCLRVDRTFGEREIDRMGGAIALEVARRGIARSPADRWAGGLSLAIPALGLNAGLIAVAGGADAGEALLRGLTVLVAVCPCALSIALPLARMRAARVAAGLGLRLRDPDAFAALASARSIVFDKTGTLTAGDLRVTALDPVPGVGGAELLELAARAETGIAHPIARAIVAAHGGDAGTGGQRHARGAEATAADGRRIRIGAGPVRGDGRSWLAVTVDGDPAGAIALSDTPAGEAGDVIAALRRRGLTPRIATGDGRDAALALARRIGLDDGAVTAGCSPSGKAGLLGGLAGPVVFVGDGVNDGPALAVADCGISVAGAHSAAAQTAGVVVTEGGLHRVVAAIDLSRRFRSVVRLNLGLALAYNAMIVPAALLGLLDPVGAALAMVASSLSVIANSARIGTAPSPEPARETGHETGHRSPSGAFVRSGMDG